MSEAGVAQCGSNQHVFENEGSFTDSLFKGGGWDTEEVGCLPLVREC